ncbi:uncharacterized protein VTP21DRAFT_11217 [Calcarisporiella thermophila]|uniref:uncharacterized protein n=1 Tax=Calcarisporiella thermophila TaxID=911321 RepID=UPI003742038B
MIDAYNIFASSCAAVVARVLTHPLDTLKTRLQISDQPQTSILQFALRLSREDPRHPWRPFYRGLPVAVAFGVPALSIYLATYDQAKSFLPQVGGEGLERETVVNHLLAGACAECVSGLVWTPMEVMKNRLQAGGDARAGEELTRESTRRLAGEIWQKEGVRGFFRGYWLSLAVFVPYTMLYFALYEELKRVARLHYASPAPAPAPTALPDEAQALPFHMYLACSAVSCAFASSVSNVLDVVKTRWQVMTSSHTSSYSPLPLELHSTPDSGSPPATPSGHGRPEEGRTVREVVVRMWRQEGWRGFTRGMLVRALWMVPSVTVSMTCFEMLKNHRVDVLGMAGMTSAAKESI